ncbi:MAG: helix-hairpin-helix domain-containing protein [Chitinophagales bacterium]
MPSHWKDWMDFTHSERNGFILLILLLLIGIAMPYFFPYFLPKEKTDFSKIENALALLEAERKKDSLESLKKELQLQKEQKTRDSLLANPFPFNPNKATFDDFVNLGLSEKVAHTILNYREKGGRFYKKEDFKKIYGISDADYHRLEAYVDIPEQKYKADKDQKTDWEKPAFKSAYSPDTTSLIVEINTADSLELMKIKGIGPAFSSLIIKYRNLLGGYRDKSQLLEVYGMDSSRWELILPHIKIDSAEINPIALNTAEWIDMVRHPYIDKNVANNIINHREYNGFYKEVSDIKTYYLVNKRLYRKIAPYLVVDDRAEAKKSD